MNEEVVSMELVSIIVPVYNVEKFLPECLDSILASTYSNLEIILVDDGSPDNSPQICDEYTHKDSRIKVIHQENQGLVAARNIGLASATGTYIGFVDSDDVVSPVLFESLVAAIEAENADIAACEYTQQQDKLEKQSYGKRRKYTSFDDFEKQLAVLTCAPSIREITWTRCYVWNKLYRKERIKNSFEKSCLLGEDLRFNWDFIHKSACKMVIVPACLYYYRQNEQSIMSLYYKKKGRIEHAIANVNCWAFIANNSHITDIDLKKHIDSRAAYLAHSTLWRIYRHGAERDYQGFVSEARNYIKEHFKDLITQKKTYNAKIFAAIWLCSNLFPAWKIVAKASALFG